MEWSDAVLFGGLALLASVLLVAAWRRVLLRWQLLDRPGTRSSHRVPTPTGGGVAVTLVVVAAWLAADPMSPAARPIAVVAAALCAISWYDDVRPLSPALRLGAHLSAALVGLWLLWPALGAALAALPGPALAWAAGLALLWAWFVNLYNFMDGIDGITGVETLSIAVGAALVAAFADRAHDLLLPAAVVAGAAAGFLVWNWHPAKLFLGDSGSVPLGFLIGWLLLELALGGAWLAALILPLYYLADTTITLSRRAVRGVPIWQAHREHFYQRAVQRGLRHSDVVLRIAACNLVLVAAAVASESHPLAAGGTAVAAVGILLWWLRRAGPAS